MPSSEVLEIVIVECPSFYLLGSSSAQNRIFISAMRYSVTSTITDIFLQFFLQFFFAIINVGGS